MDDLDQDIRDYIERETQANINLSTRRPARLRRYQRPLTAIPCHSADHPDCGKFRLVVGGYLGDLANLDR